MRGKPEQRPVLAKRPRPACPPDAGRGELAEGRDQTVHTGAITMSARPSIEGPRPELVEGMAAILAGIKAGDAERVRQILDDQPELLAAYSHDGWTSLHLAAHFGQLQVVDLLLARGAEVDARSTNNLANTALHAALAGGSWATARRLVEQGADVNAVETGGYMPLHQAADLGDAEMARFLVERGALTDVQTDDQQTPEDVARAKDHIELAEWLSRPAGRS